MTGQFEVNEAVLEWLLAPDTPGVRYLALRDLLDRPAQDAELLAAREAAHTQGPIATILENMEPEGYWVRPGAGYSPTYQSTVWSVIMLAQLGARIELDERIARACAYVLDHTLTPYGQFSTSGASSGTIDCLQGNLCEALVTLGCTDDRLNAAFDWMARSVTGEEVAPAEDRQTAVRYYADKSGPGFACGINSNLPCAWGAIKVMLAFSSWPVERRTPLMERAVQQGIDFLLSTDPADADYPAGNEKPSPNWWKLSFPVFYVADFLQNVEVLARLGYGRDPRLAHALDRIRQKQDAQGRWALEYDYYNGKMWVRVGSKNRPNKWVTLRALRALKIAAGTEAVVISASG